MRFSIRDAGALIGIAALVGLVIGLFDLWVFELSVRGFLAGMAAGFVYALLVLFLLQPGMQRLPLVFVGFAIIAGSLAGTVWWLVCRGSRLWVAMAVGVVLSLSHLAGQGLFSRRR